MTIKNQKQAEVRVLVPYGDGLNCDGETAKAFKHAGAIPQRAHLNDLYSGRIRLADYDIIAWIGGFHGGDEPNAAAIKWRFDARDIIYQMQEFAQDDKKAMIGICNGFQLLARTGILPGYEGQDRQVVSVSYNDSGNFIDKWVTLDVDKKTPCVWTRGITEFSAPIRHGEGKFVADEDVMQRMKDEGLIAIRYQNNPNGSLDDVAGICDPTGRIFGLMPHPEAYLHASNHPDYARQIYNLIKEGKTLESTLGAGVDILKNGVDYVREMK